MQFSEPYWLRPHLVACPNNDLRKKIFDGGCTVCRNFFWLVLSPLFPVPSPLAWWSSLLQILRNFSCRHSGLTLLSLSLTNLSLLFVQHACCHTGASSHDGEVGSHKRRCHPLAACIVDVAVCFNRQTVTACTSGFSRSPSLTFFVLECVRPIPKPRHGIFNIVRELIRNWRRMTFITHIVY